MVLSQQIIERIKQKASLLLDNAADYGRLSNTICEQTGRSIGQTTLKRLFGYINDERKASTYTLNTLAIFLGENDWEDLSKSMRVNSEWGYEDRRIYIKSLAIGTVITIKYLDREVSFSVVNHLSEKALKVINVVNGSLKCSDILHLSCVEEGKPIETEMVYRGESKATYKTNGEVFEIIIEP